MPYFGRGQVGVEGMSETLRIWTQRGCNVGVLQVKQEVQVLLEAKAKVQEAESRLQPSDPSDPSQDFFGRSAFLAVSGQLNAEAYACALTDVYTFGEPPPLMAFPGSRKASIAFENLENWFGALKVRLMLNIR